MNFKEHLAHLPPQFLYELARNEAAHFEARVAATELLLEGGHAQAKHADIEALVAAVLSNWSHEEIAPPEQIEELELSPVQTLNAPLNSSDEAPADPFADAPVVSDVAPEAVPELVAEAISDAEAAE
jgi:hypothetical protein